MSLVLMETLLLFVYVQIIAGPIFMFSESLFQHDDVHAVINIEVSVKNLNK